VNGAFVFAQLIILSLKKRFIKLEVNQKVKMKGSTVAMIGGLVVLCVLAFSQMEISFLASGTAHSSPNANGALLVDGAGDSKLKVSFLIQAFHIS
jgi:hypothetical protein